jgi:hypothetical protein
MPKLKAPYYPIIYVRGYAMTKAEIDETSADPFCGFNLGSTVYRAKPDKGARPRKYVFESPVVRLMGEEFGYSDVYEDGYDIVDPEWEFKADGSDTDNKLGARSIIIYRYYDAASNLLGGGKTPSILDFATNLGTLILRVRDLVCKNPENDVKLDEFRCYLIAHSMGGLVCRAFLQNPALDKNKARDCVDKLFTYATPHNGIDFAGVNVPSWLSQFDVNNFSRKEMTTYLGLTGVTRPDADRVDYLPEAAFPSRKVFCMVGTNRMDYEVAAGLSRTFVGHGSDGLVRIDNATLRGLKADGSISAPCAKAFAYRSHSGFFGIVNSEEAFQNLARFLFGDVRVDIWLDIEDIRLPLPVQEQADTMKKVDALYQVEVLASPRGKLWYLTRRIAEEDSVACVRHQNWQSDRTQHLSSVFLSNSAKVNPKRRSLAYGITLAVRVPDYEVENRLWFNEHYEGGYLFRDSLIIEMVPPSSNAQKWKVKYAWQGSGVAPADQQAEVAQLSADNFVTVSIPFESATLDSEQRKRPAFPGLTGKLRFEISAWNKDD